MELQEHGETAGSSERPEGEQPAGQPLSFEPGGGSAPQDFPVQEPPMDPAPISSVAEVPVAPPFGERGSKGRRIWVFILMLAFVGGLGTGAYYYLEQRAIEIQRLKDEEARRQEIERLARARGSVRLVTEPAGAEILSDGKPAGKTPATVGDLKLGKHEFRLRLKGHDDAVIAAEVAEEKVTDPGLIRLKRSVGRIQISTQPEGAQFVLEPAEFAGKTPLTQPATKATGGNVVPTPAGPLVELQVAGVPGPAAQKPAGAALPLAQVAGPTAPDTPASAPEPQSDNRGVFRGMSPANLDKVPTGKYVLRVQKGTWALAQDVEVLKDQSVSVRPEFIFGAVSIISDPPGAWVKRDGIALGQTPLRLDEVKPGPVTFALEMEGHETATVAGSVAPAEETQLRGELLAIGEIVLLTEPSGATVLVNGNEMGVSPLAIRGTTGNVQVKLVMAGYYEEDLTLEIKGGQRLEQKVMLQKPSGHGIGIAVPGKPGYVRSPYSPNSGLVEVRDFATGRPYVRGTEVKCPFTGRVFEVP